MDGEPLSNWIHLSAVAALSALTRAPGHWISLSWVSVVWLQIVALGAHAYRLMGRDMLHIERKGRRLRLWKLKEHVRSPDEAENLGIVINEKCGLRHRLPVIALKSSIILIR